MTSSFRMLPREIRDLVAPAAVTLPDDDAAAAEAFARGAWSVMAEPGDSTAGVVVGALGAVAALGAVVGEIDPAALVTRVADAGAELDAKAARDALARWTPRATLPLARLAFEQAARFGIRLLLPGDALWPVGVDDLGDFGPLGLWVRGQDAALAALDRGMALVGARAATGYGEHVTMESSAGLVDRGYTIVSGAAYGIDGAAHRAALAAGGTTIAFLAGGLDRFYPSGHDELLTRIAREGAVLSEVPCGTPPTKWRFLQRNRLISAASRATIVMEAGWRSGSLNTAGHAAALGRPLGAVPGPITSPASSGCHRLIRDFGAVCVTSADEMAELAPLTGLPGAALAPADRRSPGEVRVIDALSTRSAREVLDLARRSGMSTAEVAAALGTLELAGEVRESSAGWTLVR